MEGVVQFFADHWGKILGLAGLALAVPSTLLSLRLLRQRTDNARLRQAKKKLRRMAQQALELRAAGGTLPGQAKAWCQCTADAVGALLGKEARSDFLRCTEGAGPIDLDKAGDVESFLYIHAGHLKEWADAINAADLVGDDESD